MLAIAEDLLGRTFFHDDAFIHEKDPVGGFLGMGERYVVVDPSSVALTYDTGAKKWKASVNASKDALKAAPEFKYDGKFKR